MHALKKSVPASSDFISLNADFHCNVTRLWFHTDSTHKRQKISRHGLVINVKSGNRVNFRTIFWDIKGKVGGMTRWFYRFFFFGCCCCCLRVYKRYLFSFRWFQYWVCSFFCQSIKQVDKGEQLIFTDFQFSATQKYPPVILYSESKSDKFFFEVNEWHILSTVY